VINCADTASREAVLQGRYPCVCKDMIPLPGQGSNTDTARGCIELSDNVRLEEQVKTLFVNLEKLETYQKKHEDDDREAFSGVLDKLEDMRKDFQNRLPVWATFLIAALTSICGMLGGMAIK